MAATDNETRKVFEQSQQSVQEMADDIRKFVKKFSNIEQFIKDASESVDYYFSIQKAYRDKEDFIYYLKGIISIYVSYTREVYGFEDEEIENIIAFIEDNYNFLIYFGEDVNPVYRRIHSPNGSSVRTQLKPRSQKRLTRLIGL